jgi:hypothetical protein
MKKIITCLAALAVSLGMMKAADSFLYNHYSQNFSTVTAGDWGTVDSLGSVNSNYTYGFNVNGTNQNLELKVGSTSVARNTGRNVYKNWFSTPITSPDSLIVTFIYQNNGTLTSTGDYLYFCDANRKPIFGIGGDRSNAGAGNQYVPRLPLKFVSLKDSTKNFIIPAASSPALSTTTGAFQVTVIVNFISKTYSVTALKGTYTPLATPNFVAGTAAAFVRNGLPFLDLSASNISWLMHTMGTSASSGSLTTSMIFGYLDDINITQVKQYVGDANVSINSVDADGNVVKTHTVSAPIGQRYNAIASDLTSFDANGNYYVYDATNTSSLETTCTADGLASINIKFSKSVSHNGPLTWAAKTASANWNESEANFVTSLNESTPYQMGRSVIFNGADTTQTVQIASTMNLNDQDWTINGKKLIFKGAGAIATSGNLNLNLAATDSIQILNANALTGNVKLNGGYTQFIGGTFGSAKVLVQNDAEVYAIGATTLDRATDIAANKTLTVSMKGDQNGQGIAGSLTGEGNLKINLNNQRGAFACDMSQWGGKLVTIAPAKGLTSTQFVLISDASRDGMANRELYLDSLIQVAGNYTTDQIFPIGALSGTKKASLGAIAYLTNGSKKTAYVIGTLNKDTEFQGTIFDAQYKETSNHHISVEKVGTASLTLSGTALSYSGNTTVTSGKLILKGNLTSSADTVKIASGATLEVIGARALDANGTMQYTNGTIAGDIKVDGTLIVQTANLNTPNGLYMNANSTLIAKVESDSVPAAMTTWSYIDPVTTLKIAPVKSYNAGDVFRVFSAEAVGYVIGTFGTVVDADKWDVSKLYVDGTVKALAAGNGTSAVKTVETTKVGAYFTNGTLIVKGLQAGDTYKVFNTSGVQVDSRAQLQKGIYIVVVKTAKGNVTLKVANF